MAPSPERKKDMTGEPTGAQEPFTGLGSLLPLLSSLLRACSLASHGLLGTPHGELTGAVSRREWNSWEMEQEAHLVLGSSGPLPSFTLSVTDLCIPL